MKLCVFCKHLDCDGGGYGEYADAAAMECTKGYWREGIEWDLEEFRKKNFLAETCPAYELPVETKAYLTSKGVAE